MGTINHPFFSEVTKKYELKAKNDNRFQEVEDVSELFVEKVEYFSEKPKGFSMFSGFNHFSNYSSKFWEKVRDKNLFKPLPDEILNSLNNLVELKNTH